MGCNTEYMEPTVKERQQKTAAELLVYVNAKLKYPSSRHLIETADHVYGEGVDGDKVVAELCDILGGLSNKEQTKIIYDGRNEQSRRLAAWWDEHQREDAKREAAEAQEKLRDKLQPTYVVWDSTGTIRHTFVDESGNTMAEEMAKNLNGCYTMIGGVPFANIRFPK